MSDQVLSDEQLRALWSELGNLGVPDPTDRAFARLVERATIAAIAARSGVDVEALAADRCGMDDVADAIRLALATAEARHSQDLQSMADTCAASRADWEARHAEREKMWRELRDLERCDWLADEGKPPKNIAEQSRRIVELRSALGLA